MDLSRLISINLEFMIGKLCHVELPSEVCLCHPLQQLTPMLCLPLWALLLFGVQLMVVLRWTQLRRGWLLIVLLGYFLNPTLSADTWYLDESATLIYLHGLLAVTNQFARTASTALGPCGLTVDVLTRSCSKSCIHFALSVHTALSISCSNQR